MRDSAKRDYMLAVGFGQVPGHTRVTALGHNPDVDIASIPEDIWESGGVYSWPTSAVAMEMLSSSASDTSAGVGARTVAVMGLDAAYAEITQVVTMNGVTPVALPTPLLRVNTVIVLSVGTSETNVGTITLRRVVGAIVQGTIGVGAGVNKAARYSTPAGKTLQIVSFYSAINKDPPGQTSYITGAIMTRNALGVVRQSLEISLSSAGPYRHDGHPGVIVPEKTDIWLRCTYVSRDNTDITAAWLGVLKDNSVA